MTKEKLNQVLHKGCGGMLIVVGNEDRLLLMCFRCNHLWNDKMPDLQNDMHLYKPKK